ncbi:hypothetical protein PKHYL_05840 [Psychrobacter sp. KH172YL61]|uniref:hypothetical protein n=1 Tax=Psychrobacter sp. KH172YL61 TaxID=2517899 RepID=UPI0010B0704E|nr:hypothetical protein [Psychrobacter sp. KH172YL61]BBI66393.1 hypothetical protein PKHYL_05840 [Psychrobacter sp. KH172YL61]
MPRLLPTTPETTDTPAPEKVTAAYDRMAAAPYTCTDGSTIMAKQSINKNKSYSMPPYLK